MSMEPRSKSSHSGVKGRRTLQYENTSLLKGKKIYLDLHGYKRASFIESGLRERGAAIESFFTKDTKYLVTCRNLSEQDKYSSSPRTPSSSVLCNVNTNNRKTSHPAQSPFSTNSPDTPKATPFNVSRVSREQNLQQHSRSRNIVAAAKMRSTGSTDVLQLAKNWNIKIIHVEDIVKYFLKHPVGVEVSPSSEDRKLLSPGVRKLKPPFLKCEDTSRMYKPLFCEVKKWPQLNLDCGPGECPFDTPNKQRRDSDVRMKTEKSDKKRPGYCECCGVRFDDFTPHVKGEQHMAYAIDPENFLSLDTFYDTYKIPTLEQFVDANAKSSPNSSIPPEVESSPVKYALLYYDESPTTTSMVDIETVIEDQNVLQNPNDDDIPEIQPTSVTPLRNSSPKRLMFSSDFTPDAKRCRTSQSSCSSCEDKYMHKACRTPLKLSPLKRFTIVLSDSLKSPIRSPTLVKKPSPVRSPVSGNILSEALRGCQSPKHCVVLLHDITKSPAMESPRHSGTRRIVRSVSVSPEQKVSRDTLLGSPVKEEVQCSPTNLHTINDASLRHLYQPRDILQVSSQLTPQKEQH